MHRRLICRMFVLFACLIGLSALLPTSVALAQNDRRCFTETGFCISGRIRAFWEQHSGQVVFGLPISDQERAFIEGRQIQIQWFERGRLELHPNYRPPYDVQLGRLGADLLAGQGRNWQDFPRTQPVTGCRFFAETGHQICDEFLTAWRASGLELDGQSGISEAESLALFGLPLSDQLVETLDDGRRYTVQWFERARFELHPESPQPYRVQLGLLGRQLRAVILNAPTATAHFEPSLCPFAVPDDLFIDCGVLVTPEDRSQADGPTVRLAVAIVHTQSSAPDRDAVVYLAGGPGSGAVADTVFLARGWAGFLASRDLIIVDQRGTGLSTPSLLCGESDQLSYELIEHPFSRSEKVQGEYDALLRCRDRLQSAGINLSAYTSAASVDDLEDLRAALGYGRWNLFGISYGTRLALTAIRDHPEGLRSVILDSTYPPQVHLYADMPANIDRALRTLFRGCAADTSCNAAYPDLEELFYTLVARLDTNPIIVQAYDPIRKQTVHVWVDGSELINLTFRMLYSSPSIPSLPRMIGDTANGDYTTLAELESRRLARMGGFSHGMYFAVQCSEEIPFASEGQMQAALDAFPRLRTFFAGIIENTNTIDALCSAWGVHPPSSIENEPVVGSIPALILAGAYDPITPPEWGLITARTLAPSFYYQFPGTGHAVITRGSCPISMIRNFLSDPTSPPDSSCITTITEPDF